MTYQERIDNLPKPWRFEDGKIIAANGVSVTSVLSVSEVVAVLYQLIDEKK